MWWLQRLHFSKISQFAYPHVPLREESSARFLKFIPVFLQHNDFWGDPLGFPCLLFFISPSRVSAVSSPVVKSIERLGLGFPQCTFQRRGSPLLVVIVLWKICGLCLLYFRFHNYTALTVFPLLKPPSSPKDSVISVYNSFHITPRK